MAKINNTNFYEKQIIDMVKSRNGEFEEWLRPQVESAAMNRVILAKIQDELVEQNSLSVFSDGSMGQKKREAHPLLAVYDKMQRTLLLQYEALGLNYKTTPSKVVESTKKQSQEDDPLVKFYKTAKDATQFIEEE